MLQYGLQIQSGQIAEGRQVEQRMPQFVYQDVTTVFTQLTLEMRGHERLQVVILGIQRNSLPFGDDRYATAFGHGLGNGPIDPGGGFLMLGKNIKDASMPDQVFFDRSLKIDA